jgi:hypothetical protein
MTIDFDFVFHSGGKKKERKGKQNSNLQWRGEKKEEQSID